VNGNPDYRHEAIYEDEDHVAFLDRWPTVPGKVLVAPKAHIEHVVRDVDEAAFTRLPGSRGRFPHPGVGGGVMTGRSPVDRGGTGSKRHLIIDATGVALAVTLAGGDRHDVTQLIPLVQAVPPVRGKRGRPRRRRDVVLADRGYDHGKYCRLVGVLGVMPLIACRGAKCGCGLGVQRWFVERAFAHRYGFRRLCIRWEICADLHEAFLALACALICWRRLDWVVPN
jgi:transposase